VVSPSEFLQSVFRPYYIPPGDIWFAKRMGFGAYQELCHQTFAGEGFPLVYIRNSKAGSYTVLDALSGLARRRQLYLGRGRRKTPLFAAKVEEIGTGEVDDNLSLPTTPIRQFFHSSQYTSFSFVRDPYARVLSGFVRALDPNFLSKQERLQLQTEVLYSQFEFNHRRPDRQDLIKYLQFIGSRFDTEPWFQIDVHYRRQVDNLRRGSLQLNFIGKMETFRHDFNHLMQQSGLYCPKFTFSDRLNSFRSHRFQNLWTAKARDLVWSLYRDDFEEYGYDRRLPECSC